MTQERIPTMTRTQVLERIPNLTGFQLRNFGAAPSVLMGEDGGVRAIRPDRGTRSIDMTPTAIESLLRQIYLREPLAKKLTPKTKGLVLNEALADTPMALMVKDHQAIDVVPARTMRLLQPERVTQMLEKAIDGAEFCHVSELSGHVLHLEIMGHQELAVARGDLVRAGVSIDFPVIGGRDVAVQSYVQRLICTNGAITNDFMGEYSYREHGGDDGNDVIHWMRLKARAAYRAIDKVVERWIELTHQEVPAADRASVLEHWIQESRIPPDVADEIRAQAVNEPPANQYDMMNLITWGTSHTDMEPNKRRRSLQNLATLQLHTVSGRVCPRCHSQLAGH